MTQPLARVTDRVERIAGTFPRDSGWAAARKSAPRGTAELG
jgi:hypothetical protein